MIPLYEPSLKAYEHAVIQQLATGWIGPGETCQRFAKALGERHDRHCTLTNSGTSALMLALWALDLPAGSVICCPDYGLPACHNAARLLGHRVRLIDVNPATGAMSFSNLREQIGEGAACVVFVDHNGYCGAELDAVKVICADYNVPLIEDSAVALGCSRAGTIGDLSIFSFSVPKIITTGQGGAVLTKDPKLAERLEQLADQGAGEWRKTRVHSAIGGNFRLTDMQAALGLAQLYDLPRLLTTRREIWDWYRTYFFPAFDSTYMRKASDPSGTGWMVTYLARDRVEADAIIAAVRAVDADCRRLYVPVHRCGPYEEPDERFPGATDLYDRLVYFPSSLTLTREQVDKIGTAAALAIRSRA